MLISEDSPLRLLPSELSRKQILIFDGIRYAAEMTDIAYRRLSEHLQKIANTVSEPTTCEIASAMLDAWSIVDSVHRFRDLVDLVPGVSNAPWKRLLSDRTATIAKLRDCVQHQSGEIDGLIEIKGQIWGYLSWAGVKNGVHSGKWFMMSPGTFYAGDKWVYMGPTVTPVPLPLGRIRLSAFGQQIYLGLCVEWVRAAANSLASELANGAVRLVGEVENERRGSDILVEGMMIIEYRESPPTPHRAMVLAVRE